MEDKPIKPKKYIVIGIMVLLILLGLFLIYKVLNNKNAVQENISTLLKNELGEIATESSMYDLKRDFNYFQSIQDQQGNRRSLHTFYARRAYPGAPPFIPHRIQSDMEFKGFSNCLSCHANGGFSAEFKAYAPVTPHPEKVNCSQCHVPQKTGRLFKATNWLKIDPTSIGNSAMLGSPPPIPHSLQLRENCLACHAGPSAVKELRVSHPERINCRQCHAETNADQGFIRNEGGKK